MLNHIGLEKKDYGGSPSTLCTGCGHDSITNHIQTALFQLGINPYDVYKMSGIGCSSKTPAYFMSMSYGFNSMHGRMAPVATGAKVVAPHLIQIGVSGDGDTSSIGIGGFIHMIRRNLPICYVIANNGVYGLTKGQFSPTAERGAELKSGEHNIFQNLDLCSLAIEAGATFVARSFSGDAKQLVPLLKAGLQHRGTAIIDVVSPCITFNNHDGSTKSYNYVKEHDINLQELGFIAAFEELKVDYEAGTQEIVRLPDGSHLLLKKLSHPDHPEAHNVHDRIEAMRILHHSNEKKEILTGLFYIDESTPSLIERLNLVDRSLRDLTEAELRPAAESFQKIMDGLK